MKNWDFKRTFVTVLEKENDAYARQNAREAVVAIQQLKKKQDKQGKLLDSKGKRDKGLEQKIRQHRELLRARRSESWVIKVFIKKYKWTYKTEVSIDPWNMNIAKLIRDRANEVIAIYRKSNAPVKPWFFDRKKPGNKLLYYPRMSIIGTPTNHVFDKPNQIYYLYVKNKVKDIYTEKKPTQPTKYIGLELEFCAKIEEIPFSLELFKLGIHQYAQLKKDGSLRPQEGETGYELALLLPERSYKKYLKLVCNLLNKIGAVTVERRCGLHVHVDMRRRNKDIVYNNFVACQSLLLGLVDPQRRDNEFCVSVKSRKFPTHFTMDRQERYKTINAAAYYKYKTLELRMHQASINYKEIANWMDLLIKIANYSKKMKTDVKELTVLSKRFKMNNKLRSFFQDRMCYWQVNNTRPVNRFGGSVPTRLRDLQNDIAVEYNEGAIGLTDVTFDDLNRRINVDTQQILRPRVVTEN